MFVLLKCVRMSSVRVCVNLVPLKMCMSRNVIAWFDVSQVNLMVSCDELRLERKLSSYRSVPGQTQIMSSMYRFHINGFSSWVLRNCCSSLCMNRLA